MKTLIAMLILVTNTAFAANMDSISIYDLTSDKTKVIVEYCNIREQCFRLVTPKATLQEDYDKIEAWLVSVSR